MKHILTGYGYVHCASITLHAYADDLHSQPLAQADPRLEIVAKSGIEWDTYVHMEEAGLLEGVETLPWEAGRECWHRYDSFIWLIFSGTSTSTTSIYFTYTPDDYGGAIRCADFPMRTGEGMAIQVRTRPI